MRRWASIAQLVSCETSKYHRASTGCPFTVTFVAFWKTLPSVITVLNRAMYGMPTPTADPSEMLTDTCTVTCLAAGAELLLDGAARLDIDELDDVGALLPWPPRLDVHAVRPSAIARTLDMSGMRRRTGMGRR